MKKTLAILATCAALPASAASFGPYDNLYVFGDSLSDSGNVATALGPSFPSFVYPNGQFTNGDAWTTQLGLTPSLAGGTNYAWGGARAADNGDSTPDLMAQIGAFTSTIGMVTGNPLAVIWVGGNDFRDLPDMATPGDVKDLVISVTGAISSGVQQLVGAGISDVVIFGLPDFGILPQYKDDPLGAGGATFASNLLNGAIEATAEGLNGLPTADVDFFDLDALIDNVLADVPASKARIRCLDAVFDCAMNPTDYVFYDDIHPTEWVHERLAEGFNEQVLQPVPLPAGGALLITALIGFGALTRKSRSQV